MRRVRRILRRRRPVDRRRLCAAGLHPERVYVRVHVGHCGIGACPGHHAGLRCTVCGATWDLVGDPDSTREALR